MPGLMDGLRTVGRAIYTTGNHFGDNIRNNMACQDLFRGGARVLELGGKLLHTTIFQKAVDEMYAGADVAGFVDFVNGSRDFRDAGLRNSWSFIKLGTGLIGSALRVIEWFGKMGVKLFEPLSKIDVLAPLANRLGWKVLKTTGLNRLFGIPSLIMSTGELLVNGVRAWHRAPSYSQALKDCAREWIVAAKLAVVVAEISLSLSPVAMLALGVAETALTVVRP